MQPTLKNFVENLMNQIEDKSFIDYDEYYTDGGECLITVSNIKKIIDQLTKESTS